jgi:hypothetical protein
MLDKIIKRLDTGEFWSSFKGWVLEEEEATVYSNYAAKHQAKMLAGGFDVAVISKK